MYSSDVSHERKKCQYMSIFDSIGKGFRFFLMSIGVSTYAKKPPAKAPVPPAAPTVKPE